MIKKLERFADELRTLNPSHTRKIRVAKRWKTIRLFNISPRSLRYPDGYYWNSKAHVITNKGNVPFWKVKRYHVTLRKRT